MLHYARARLLCSDATRRSKGREVQQLTFPAAQTWPILPAPYFPRGTEWALPQEHETDDKEHAHTHTQRQTLTTTAHKSTPTPKAHSAAQRSTVQQQEDVARAQNMCYSAAQRGMCAACTALPSLAWSWCHAHTRSWSPARMCARTVWKKGNKHQHTGTAKPARVI